MIVKTTFNKRVTELILNLVAQEKLDYLEEKGIRIKEKPRDGKSKFILQAICSLNDVKDMEGEQ